MSSLFVILGLFIISSLGVSLYFFQNISQKILHLLIALGAGTMLSVALVHILPEALQQSSSAIYAFITGFIIIYLIEEVLTPHHHDQNHDDHTHEDPHEHYKHIVLVAWIALCIHTIFDGLGIRAGFMLDTSIGISILAGVTIHQIPVSLSLASMLRESHIAKKMQLILLAVFAGAAPLGFIASGMILPHVSLVTVSLATALAGGSLLYVSTVELLPMIHAQSTKKMKYITVTLFVVGVIGMSAVKLWE